MGTMLALLLAAQGVDPEPLVRKGSLYLTTRVEELRKDPEFGVWILLSVGVPTSAPAVHTLLDDALQREPTTTRSAALQAMSLELLDPVKYRNRIIPCAQFLLDNQCGDGRWDAGKPIGPMELPPEPKRAPPPRAFGGPPPRILQKIILRRRSEGAKTGDSVNSRWAAWGLLACHQSGIVIPIETIEKAARSWREGDHDPADLVSSLSIHLHLKNKDWKHDPDVLKGVDRLAIRDPRTEPTPLFLLKRAMDQYGSGTLGTRPWWQDGARILAASQGPDGGWGSVEDTCCATWFLRK